MFCCCLSSVGCFGVTLLLLIHAFLTCIAVAISSLALQEEGQEGEKRSLERLQAMGSLLRRTLLSQGGSRPPKSLLLEFMSELKSDPVYIEDEEAMVAAAGDAEDGDLLSEAALRPWLKELEEE